MPPLINRRLRRVLACSVDGSGRYLVTGGDDSVLKVWDLENGAEIRTIVGHRSAVRGCALSPDGRLVVSVSADRSVRVSDTATGLPIAVQEDAHAARVFSCAFSESRNQVFTAGEDSLVKVWTLERGNLRLEFSLPGHSGRVSWVALSDRAGLLVSACEDATLRVWDLSNMATIRVLRGHSARVVGCDISSDGTHIASASSDGTARIWATSNDSEPVVLRAHLGETRSCAFSPDGRRLVTGGENGVLLKWQVDGVQIGRELRGHLDAVRSCTFIPKRDGIVSVSADGTARVWSSNEGDSTHVLYGHAGPTCFFASRSPDPTVLFVSGDGLVHAYELATSVTASAHTAIRGSVQTLASTSSKIVYALRDGAVLEVALPDQAVSELIGPDGQVKKLLRVSEDGESVLIGGSDGVAYLFESGRRFARLQSDTGALRCGVLLSHEETWEVILGGDRGRIVFWCPGIGRSETIFSGDAPVWTLASCGIANWLAAGLYNGQLLLFEATSRALLFSMEAHSGPINSCSFSPDGRMLMTTSEDRTLRVWGVPRLELLVSLRLDDDIHDCFWHERPYCILGVGESGVYCLTLQEAKSSAGD